MYILSFPLGCNRFSPTIKEPYTEIRLMILEVYYSQYLIIYNFTGMNSAGVSRVLVLCIKEP